MGRSGRHKIIPSMYAVLRDVVGSGASIEGLDRVGGMLGWGGWIGSGQIARGGGAQGRSDRPSRHA